MGPSIEELKALAASRAESFGSPSTTSLAQGSQSGIIGLSLPSEPLKSNIRHSSTINIIDSQNFLKTSVADPKTTSHENLRNTAQTINSLIQKDKIQPDLGELLNGQFSREYIYGDEHRPILQFTKHSLIPEILLNQVRQVESKNGSKEGSNCFMGLFPEIKRAWLTAGNAFYLWSFENNRDFTHYLKSQYEIIDVALVRPRAGIFHENVEWIVVLVTPMEIVLLAVVFKSPDQSSVSHLIGPSSVSKNYSALDLVLCETGFTFPSDEVNMVSVIGTKDGRIFTAGSDGNIYELIYQSESNWFGPKCKKINRTSSPFSYVIPTFLRSSPSRTCVVKLNYDPSRNIIYGLTEQSTIHVYWLGPNGQDFEFVGVTGDLSAEAVKLTPAGIISSTKSLNIVSIYPVETSESDIIGLVAICRSGIRLYFSIISSIPSQVSYPQSNLNQQHLSQAPRGIRLAHLRAPPEENRVRDPKKLVHRWSPNIHSAFHSNGVTLVANTISNEADIILGMIINPSAASSSASIRLPFEYSVESAIDGKVWAIEELPPLEKPTNSDIKGLGKEFSLAHLLPRRSFAVLTNVGVYFYSKLRPVDQLLLLLSETTIPWDKIENFFNAYGFDQACAFCISLCCRPSESLWGSSWNGNENSLSFNNNIILLLMKFGGQPALIDSYHERNYANSRNQENHFRDGIGRIIATQPEFENSPMHEGFYIFFSRLVSSIWKRSIWDINSIPIHLIIDLGRFYKFLSENITSLIERRHIPINAETHSDLFHRLQNAIEFENDSFLRLKELSGLLIELLTFLTICNDYKLLESIRSERICIENPDLTIESLLVSNKGKSIITQLGNILVQKQLRLRAPIRPLCENLRSRCSSFFTEEDVFLQEGLEALERARLCRSNTERVENIIEALSALKKACNVIPAAEFYQIIDTLDSLGAQDTSLSLSLHFVNVLDPENIGLRREFNPNLQLNSEEHEICRQREQIYDRLMDSFASTGFDTEKTAVIQANNPSLDIKVLRDKFLNFASASKDELFHYRIYEWLVKSQFSQVLLEFPHTEFLKKYLVDSFHSRINSHRDLLWKWLARSQKYSEAASVLAVIAEVRDYPLTLSERIEYISLAITHCKSSALEPVKESISVIGVEDIPTVDLRDLETLLEVANTQFEAFKEARSLLSGKNESVCNELNGAAGLLTVSDLFYRYAQPYGLTESCLRLIHISGLVNERIVAQLWQDIISKYIGNSPDIYSFHQLGAKITELARKFYPSPNALPLVHLIDVLGRLALDYDIGADWLIAVLINAGIPFNALSDDLHRFVTSPPSKTWLKPQFRKYILEMIVILFNIWMKNQASIIKDDSSIIISRLTAYSIAADEIQHDELVNEYGMLLKQIATN